MKPPFEKQKAGRPKRPANLQALHQDRSPQSGPDERDYINYRALNAIRLHLLRELWWRRAAKGVRLPPPPGVIILDGGRL